MRGRSNRNSCLQGHPHAAPAQLRDVLVAITCRVDISSAYNYISPIGNAPRYRSQAQRRKRGPHLVCSVVGVNGGSGDQRRAWNQPRHLPNAALICTSGTGALSGSDRGGIPAARLGPPASASGSASGMLPPPRQGQTVVHADMQRRARPHPASPRRAGSSSASSAAVSLVTSPTGDIRAGYGRVEGCLIPRPVAEIDLALSLQGGSDPSFSCTAHCGSRSFRQRSAPREARGEGAVPNPSSAPRATRLPRSTALRRRVASDTPRWVH